MVFPFSFWSNEDADISVYRTNVIANGGTVSGTTITALATFVKTCKTNGLWSKLVEVYPFCGSDLAAARTKLKFVSPSSLMANTGSFVSGDYVETGSTTGGLKGNGSSKYLDSGFNPVTHSSVETDFHLLAYVKGTESSGSRVLIGSQHSVAGSAQSTLLGWVSSGTKEQGAIASTGLEFSPSTSTAAKEGALMVTTSGSRSQIYYHNGASVGTAVSATSTFLSVNLTVMARRTELAVGLYSTRYLRFISIGTGFSAQNALDYYNAVHALQTALGRNV